MNAPSTWSWLSGLKPKGSHVLLCVLASIGAWIASWGADLIRQGETARMSGFVIFFTGILIIGAVVFGWLRSFTHRELAGGLTEVQRTADGHISIRSDIRLFTDPNTLRGFTEVLNTAAHMQPLPQPAGVVDAKGNPVPDSEQRAAQLTAAINKQTQQYIDQLVRAMSLRKQVLKTSSAVRQPPEQPQSLLEQESSRNEAGVGPLPDAAEANPLA